MIRQPLERLDDAIHNPDLALTYLQKSVTHISDELSSAR